MTVPRAAIWQHPEYRRGARDMGGPALGIGMWGLVTGVAMVKSGLSAPMAVAMSLLVFAGSAQLAVIPLLGAGAPLWVVWATAACVNLRFIILSAQWRPYFDGLPLVRRLHFGFFAADLNFVLFMKRFPEPAPAPGQWPYFWGGVSMNWTAWQAMSIAGIVLGERIPAQWGLGFAGILALIGLTASMLVDRACRIAAAVAAVAAVAAYGLPLKLNIVVAIAAAIVAGLLVDRGLPAGPATSEDRT